MRQHNTCDDVPTASPGAAKLLLNAYTNTNVAKLFNNPLCGWVGVTLCDYAYEQSTGYLKV
jgi:hypothetical protein